MTSDEVKELADNMASILLSYAAHGLATASIDGMGEITLRDGLTVAAAASGARARQAWILEREVLPQGWTDFAVDLVISRRGNRGRILPIGGTELKWWRQTDQANAANRRKEIIKDLIRAASLYTTVDYFSFVVLLSTAGSWRSTTNTNASDKLVMKKLAARGSQSWNLRHLIQSGAVKGAIRALHGRVPLPNIFHTELLSFQTINSTSGSALVFAKVWAVRKPQNTNFLQPIEIETLLPGTSIDRNH